MLRAIAKARGTPIGDQRSALNRYSLSRLAKGQRKYLAVSVGGWVSRTEMVAGNMLGADAMAIGITVNHTSAFVSIVMASFLFLAS